MLSLRSLPVLFIFVVVGVDGSSVGFVGSSTLAMGVDATGFDTTGVDTTGVDATGFGATGVGATGVDATVSKLPKFGRKLSSSSSGVSRLFRSGDHKPPPPVVGVCRRKDVTPLPTVMPLPTVIPLPVKPVVFKTILPAMREDDPESRLILLKLAVAEELRLAVLSDENRPPFPLRGEEVNAIEESRPRLVGFIGAVTDGEREARVELKCSVLANSLRS